jgi:hypothetical protein
MADILDAVDWWMQRRDVTDGTAARHKPWYDDVSIFECECRSRPLTRAEWRAVVNPAGPWELHYEFGGCGLPRAKNSDGALVCEEWVNEGTFGGVIDFGAEATVRDVLGAIAALPARYGYWEGFCKCNEGDRTWYVLQYGT